jgi:hypothetical protein
MTQQTPAIHREKAGRRWAGIAATATSVVVYWMLHVHPLTLTSGFSWRNFRDYFPYDQYSYLAIAVNVRNGNLAAVEPFTETGINHYPRLYYVFLGLTSRVFGTDIVATWQVTGVAFQIVMVTAISWLLIRLTGRPLAGVFGFVPSIIGTLAVVSTGNWYQSLDNHAVLWGAFGVFFTLNGESAALSLAVASVCLIVGMTFPQAHGNVSSERVKWAAIMAASAAIGVLANVQTYSFLTAVYLLVFATAAYGLLGYGSRTYIVVSLLSLTAVIFGGPSIAAMGGPLVTLMVGLLPAAPGFALVLRKHRSPMIGAALAAALAASPTIVGTLVGLASEDEFLTYREASSTALGVPLWPGVVAALAPIIMLGLIFWAGIAQRNKAWQAFSLGAGVAWALVASNDQWGANQEPYRFWIDSFTLITATSVPVLFQVGLRYWTWWRRRGWDDGATFKLGWNRLLVSTACLSLAAVIALGMPDFAKFSTYVQDRGTESFNDPQANAIRVAVIQGIGGIAAADLLLADPCISPFRVKTLTGTPTAFYNMGLAWPEHEKVLREVLKDRATGIFARSEAESAGVGYLLTDSSCPAAWHTEVDGTKVAEESYGADGKLATVTLWKLASDRPTDRSSFVAGPLESEN